MKRLCTPIDSSSRPHLDVAVTPVLLVDVEVGVLHFEVFILKAVVALMVAAMVGGTVSAMVLLVPCRFCRPHDAPFATPVVTQITLPMSVHSKATNVNSTKHWAAFDFLHRQLISLKLPLKTSCDASGCISTPSPTTAVSILAPSSFEVNLIELGSTSKHSSP